MLYLVTALAAEARPLVDHFGLRREGTAGPFPVYRGEEMALVVSGIGKSLAAAATAYLWARSDERPGAFLDLGIAGGRLPVGKAVLAHTVRDRAGGRCWYPPLVFAPPCAVGTVVTVDRVERHFEDDTTATARGVLEPGPVLYEMEAAGFLAAATRCVTTELVHCLKIVSDGPGDEPEKTLDKHRVGELIGDRLDTIATLGEALLALARERTGLEADPAELATCLERWHFTVSDRKQLERHLRRRRHLAPDQELPLEDLPPRARGRDVNRRLGEWLDTLPVRLG